MNGCTRSMIQSYIDEYVWRHNNNCTTNREKSYELILHEIAKNYNPGQALRDFEEKYEKCVPTDNEYFDFDSQSESGSETNSENDLEELENNENMAKEKNLGNIFENEKVVDESDAVIVDKIEASDEEEEFTVAGKSISGSSTLNQNVGLSDSVCDAEDISTDDEDKEIVSNQTKKIDELSSDLKKKAVLCEIRALELPKNSSETTELLKKTLSQKKNPMPCPVCGAYMEGERGVNMHLARSHRDKK